ARAGNIQRAAGKNRGGATVSVAASGRVHRHGRGRVGDRDYARERDTDGEAAVCAGEGVVAVQRQRATGAGAHAVDPIRAGGEAPRAAAVARVRLSAEVEVGPAPDLAEIDRGGNCADVE